MKRLVFREEGSPYLEGFLCFRGIVAEALISVKAKSKNYLDNFLHSTYYEPKFSGSVRKREKCSQPVT